MSFCKSTPGAVLGALILCVAILVGGAVARVHGTITPPRQDPNLVDFDSVMLRVDRVGFPAVDGLPLEGWLLEGRPSVPSILVCHDLGSSKASLVRLAMELNEAGFPVLLFDFRGHGESAGGRSTLGLNEKRDVLGAIDYLSTREEIDGRRIGVYGVGMGAHAAVLAAADRPSVRVLVLDGLYPDAAYPLVRGFYSEWGPGVRRLAFLPSTLFMVLNGIRIREERAAEVLEDLVGRDVLLLAPAGDPALAVEMYRMYEAIPEQRDVDGNLVVLPATQSEGLYGEDLERHHGQVSEFFLTRLPRRGGGPGGGEATHLPVAAKHGSP